MAGDQDTTAGAANRPEHPYSQHRGKLFPPVDDHKRVAIPFFRTAQQHASRVFGSSLIADPGWKRVTATRHQAVPMNLLRMRNRGRYLVLCVMLLGVVDWMELVCVMLRQSFGNGITLAQMVLMNDSQVR